MDILKLIEQDHRYVKNLFREVSRHAEEAGESMRLVNELITEILLHSKSEEKALYRACKEKEGKLRNFAYEGHVEHKLLEIALKRLSTVPPAADGEFRALVKVARDLFLHHAIEEEEKEIFPKIKKNFTKAERREMGAYMLEVKESLRAKQNGVTRAPAIEPAPGVVGSAQASEHESGTDESLETLAQYENGVAGETETFTYSTADGRDSHTAPAAAADLPPSGQVPVPGSAIRDDQPMGNVAPLSVQLKGEPRAEEFPPSEELKKAV